MTLIATAALRVLAATLFVECEGFDDLGGWKVDPHSMRQMGSSYVMAHGAGVPVRDAVTRVNVNEAGTYSVWARTRNWNAEWTKGAAGRFRVRVNGQLLPETLGTGAKDWRWAKAGTVGLPKGQATLALHDLTGFNGRCDVLCLTTDSGEPVRPKPVLADAYRAYDHIVVGGGISGICAALAASRYGVETLLLQDRPVLGGCNSSEIRVSAGGFMHTGPYPALGNVLEEILPVRGDYCVLPGKFYEDDRKANAFSFPGKHASLVLNQHVHAVEKDGGGRLVAVVARDTRTGRDTRYRAKMFTDATGDGVIARLAGCSAMYGREERSRWGEACAPVKADRQVMGHSIQWTTEHRPGAKFPDIDWCLPFTEKTVHYVRGGIWWQEAGQYRDMSEETEAIRDYGLLAIFSNWSYIRNRSARKAEFANAAISWVSPVGGKRESYRIVGDYVLTEADLENQAKFDDGTAVITWDIDFHFPDPDNAKEFAEPFRSCAYHRGFGNPVQVPYRCLYAKDCPNLFLAGRDISCSHGAFAAVRVQRTLGMLGEVVGIAAGICKEKACLPRDVYAKCLELLKARMRAGVPKQEQYVAFGGGLHEKYHFADLGFVPVWPNPATNLTPHQVEAIRSLGMVHRHPHPQLDARRRLVLADESRPALRYYDSSDPAKCFAIPGERPMWDLKKVGEGRYRAVCYQGFKVYDLPTRKVVDEFRDRSEKGELTAVCDLPEGGFIASVNPVDKERKDKMVLVVRYDRDRRRICEYAFRGIFNARAMMRRDNGELLITHEHGFVRGRLPEQGTEGVIVQDFKQPAGRNLFEVVPDRAGTGYWAGTGYGAELVHFRADGTIASVWTAKQTDGKKNFFYAQPQELASGHVYLCNWTGHGAQDSSRGWQVIEFDAAGNVVWHLDNPAEYGSISGIDVLEAPGRDGR